VRMLRGSWEPQLLAAAAPALPGATEGLDLLLLPAATARAPTTTAAKTALQDYKRLCDVLLPALRARSHLFNLIYSSHSTVNVTSENVCQKAFNTKIPIVSLPNCLAASMFSDPK
jgi:hypothetical protein